MDREEQGQMTPSEKADRMERTGQKMSAKQALVESKYQLNQQGKQEQGGNSRLDEIEDEIKKCGRRLEQIYYELAKQTDKNSDKALDLEHERGELKKRIIDLDYDHRVECANTIRESRRRSEEERERIVREAQEERQRRRQQIEQRIQKQNQAREKARQDSEARENEGGESEQPQEAGEGAQEEGGEATTEEKLERSRRELRIAQIEAELASERLRRSRVSSLSAELEYLRATYTYPTWTWRDYSLLYPYSYSLASPYSLTSPYSLASPYSLYPYRSYIPPYSSYLYPYRRGYWY